MPVTEIQENYLWVSAWYFQHRHLIIVTLIITARRRLHKPQYTQTYYTCTAKRRKIHQKL